VAEIESHYRLRVVEVMSELLPSKKSAALEVLAKKVFEDLRFDAFNTDMGIVGTRWEDDRPIIFNRSNPVSDARSRMPWSVLAPHIRSSSRKW
jgi:hypothetical protein